MSVSIHLSRASNKMSYDIKALLVVNVSSVKRLNVSTFNVEVHCASKVMLQCSPCSHCFRCKKNYRFYI